MNIDKLIEQIDPQKDYRLKEISEIFEVSYTAILNSVKRGNFPSRKVFNRIYVKGVDIIRYLTKR